MKNKNIKLKDITEKSRLFTTYNKELGELIERLENYSISCSITENKNAFDILSIINYLLSDLLDLIQYEAVTEEERKDQKTLKEIKNKILEIKNKNI